MSNKQGQQGNIGNKKQEGQGNQGFQEKTKREQQDGKAAHPQGPGRKAGPQPGSQKDRKGRIGL